MSLATIIKKIDEEAIIQSQELIEQARVEDEQIVAYARVKAEEEAHAIIRRAEEELQTLQNKQMATTLLHLRKERLDNRQRILGEVFESALHQLKAFDADQIRSLIKAILLSVSEERQGTLILSPTELPLIDQTFVDHLNEELTQRNRKLQFTLSTKTADIDRGFIVDFEDFEVNYSIEKVLASLWTEIEGEVSTHLFEREKQEEN